MVLIWWFGVKSFRLNRKVVGYLKIVVINWLVCAVSLNQLMVIDVIHWMVRLWVLFSSHDFFLYFFLTSKSRHHLSKLLKVRHLSWWYHFVNFLGFFQYFNFLWCLHWLWINRTIFIFIKIMIKFEATFINSLHLEWFVSHYCR